MIKAYVLGFIAIALYFSGAYAIQVFLVSLLIALIPLATSRFWFGLPLLILAYSFLFGSATFAWLCIIFAPFHWISFMHLVIQGIKNLFGVSD